MPQFSVLFGEQLSIALGSADGAPGGASNQLFTLVRRKAAINAGQREFARLTKCFRRQFPVSLADDTGEYDLEALITALDFLALDKQGIEICYTTSAGVKTYISGDSLTQTTVAELNQVEPGWRGATAGTPCQWYLREADGKTYLGFFPAPTVTAGDTSVVTVPYRALPADMTLDADLPFKAGTDSALPLTDYHQALVHYAAAQLELLRRDFQAVDFHERRFSAYVDQYLSGHKPIGGLRLTFARNYRRERAHGDLSPLLRDPRR